MSSPETSKSRKYRAFISYSHAADGKLAPALQSALQRFTKPWYRLRVMRVFRDTTGLGLTAELWPEIERALRESDYFLLLASPPAAQSKWVEQEVDYWLRHRSADRLLIIWTDGDLELNETASDFSWSHTDALPRRLEKAFGKTPFYLDFRWARNVTDLSLRNPDFLDSIATIASPLLGRAKDDLISEEVREFRKTRRLVRTTLAVLVALTFAAVLSTLFAFKQRTVAVERLAQMTTATGLREQETDNLPFSVLWFTEALKLEAGNPAGEERQRIRLASALQFCPRLAQVWLADKNLRWTGFDSEGRWVVATSARDPADPEDLAHWTDPRPWQILGTTVWDAQTGEELPLPNKGKDSPIHDAHLTAQEKLVLTVSGRVVEIWDVETKAKRRSLEHETEIITAIFAGEGSRVVTTSTDRSVRVWNAQSGQLIHTLPHETRVAGASLSADDRKLLAQSLDKSVYLWDLENKTNREFRLNGPVLSAKLNANETQLFTLTSEGIAKVWDVKSGDEVSSLGNFAMVDHLTVSPDGGRVVMGFRGSSSVTVWDLKNDAELFSVHPDDILVDANFSPDGRQLVTGGTLGYVRVWDAHTGTPLSPPLRHPDSVMSVSLSPDGKRLTTGSGRIVRVWDLGGPKPAVLHCSDEVNSVAFDQGAEHVLVGTSWQAQWWTIGSTNSLHLSHPEAKVEGRLSADGKRLLPMDHPEGVKPYSRSFQVQLYAASLSPDERWIVTAGRDGQAALWEASTGKLRHLLQHKTRNVEDARFSPDSRHLITATTDGLVLWDVNKTNRLFRVAEGDIVKTVTFSQDGQLILSVDWPDGVRIWNAANGQELKLLQRTNARSGVLSKDGRHLAIVDASNVVILDTATGAQPVPSIPVTYGGSRNLAFSPDGTRLAVADSGNTRIWDVKTGSPLSSYLRHSNVVFGLAFSPDGRKVVTASGDKTARLWDGFTGAPLSPPLPHPDSVTHSAFSSDGRKLVTASDRQCFVWDVAADQRSADELSLLAQLLAGSRIDETSTIVPLEDQEFYDTWLKWRKLRTK